MKKYLCLWVKLKDSHSDTTQIPVGLQVLGFEFWVLIIVFLSKNADQLFLKTFSFSLQHILRAASEFKVTETTNNFTTALQKR